MNISLELLFHFRCGNCQKWWSVADLLPTNLLKITCPHCSHQQAATEIDYQGIINVNQNQAASLAQLLENAAADLRASAICCASKFELEG